MKRDKRSEKVYLPTSRDIQQACEEIQQGWSERERLKRSGRAEGRHWSPPLVRHGVTFPGRSLSDDGDSHQLGLFGARSGQAILGPQHGSPVDRMCCCENVHRPNFQKSLALPLRRSLSFGHEMAVGGGG